MSVEKEMTCDECLFPDKMGCITASNTACAIGRAYAEKVAECEKLEKDNDNLRRTIHLLNDTGCPCGVNVDVLKLAELQAEKERLKKALELAISIINAGSSDDGCPHNVNCPNELFKEERCVECWCEYFMQKAGE